MPPSLPPSPLSLQRIQVTRSGASWRGPGHWAGRWPGSARAATGPRRVQVFRVTLSGSGLPPPSLLPWPALATALRIRVAGLGGESGGAGASRAAVRCASCTHRNWRDAEAVLRGPARLACRPREHYHYECLAGA